MEPSFEAGSILLCQIEVVKLFYINGESTTIALRKFRTEKGLKAQKIPILMNGILNSVRRFEETESLEDRTSVSVGRV